MATLGAIAVVVILLDFGLRLDGLGAASFSMRYDSGGKLKIDGQKVLRGAMGCAVLLKISALMMLSFCLHLALAFQGTEPKPEGLWNSAGFG